MTYDPWDYEHHSPFEERVRMEAPSEVINLGEAVNACRNSHDHKVVISTEAAFVIAGWYASFEESLARLARGETVAYDELVDIVDRLRVRTQRFPDVISSPNDLLCLNALAWWIDENKFMPANAPFLPAPEPTIPLFA